MSNEKNLPVVAQTYELGPALSVDALHARLMEIDRLKRAVMKQGVDYGVIPGCQKPSLWQPGAEKLQLAFQLGTAIAEKEDMSTGAYGQPNHEIRYRVTVNILSLANGTVIAQGVGECSSNEDKYRWRKAVCDEEWDETPPDMRRAKWAKGRGGSTYQTKQVRTDPTSLVNTILQMATKRAIVSGMRRATAASSVFTDGVEDLQGVVDIEAATGNGYDEPEPYREPQQTAAPRANTDEGGPVISEPQRKRLFALLFKGSTNEASKKKRGKALEAVMQDQFGLDSTKAIPKAQYEAICAEAERIAAETEPF